MAVTERSAGRHASAFTSSSQSGIRVARRRTSSDARLRPVHPRHGSCRVPADGLLGTEACFVDSMKILDGGRISIAALSLGIAREPRGGAPVLEGTPPVRKPSRSSRRSILPRRHGDGDRRRAGLDPPGRGGEDSARRSRASPPRPSSTPPKWPCGRRRRRSRSPEVGSSRTSPVEKFYRDVRLCTIGEDE